MNELPGLPGCYLVSRVNRDTLHVHTWQVQQYIKFFFLKSFVYLPASTILASQFHVFTRNSEWKGYKTMNVCLYVIFFFTWMGKMLVIWCTYSGMICVNIFWFTGRRNSSCSPCGRCWLNVGIFNPLNPELNPICYLLALLGAHNFLHVSRIRVKLLTFRLLMSYIYIYIYIYMTLVA